MSGYLLASCLRVLPEERQIPGSTIASGHDRIFKEKRAMCLIEPCERDPRAIEDQR